MELRYEENVVPKFEQCKHAVPKTSQWKLGRMNKNKCGQARVGGMELKIILDHQSERLHCR